MPSHQINDKPNLDAAADPQTLALISDCLATVGGTAFNRRFIALAGGPLAADQCTIFAYQPEQTRCYLSYDSRPSGRMRLLAEDYVLRGHAMDPVRPRLLRKSHPDGIAIVPLSKLRHKMSAAYHQEFYEAPGIVDKIAVLAKRGSLGLCLNFYRWAETGPYPADAVVRLASVLTIAGQLALLHYSSSHDQSLENPLLTLSDREREVCHFILKGLATDAIAYEMDVSPHTIATYRKRAYEKLSINSKAALFALCQPQAF